MTVWNILASLFAAVLASMGVGGGGLLVIYLVLVLNMDQIRAQGINLLFFICASVCSLPLHFKKKRIQLKTALIFGLSGAGGSIIGCMISGKLDPKYVRLCFGIFLIFAGALTLFKVAKNYYNKFLGGASKASGKQSIPPDSINK